MQSPISELDVMFELNSRFGGVSTRIKDIIMSYIGYPQEHTFVPRNYKLTTQTVIIELSGIQFNDFRLDTQTLAHNLEILLNTHSSSKIGRIMHIESKRMEITVQRDPATRKFTVASSSSMLSKHN